MTRALTSKNLLAIKHTYLKLTGEWQEVFGEPEDHGFWLIWGAEKHGKTWCTMLLADMLSDMEKTYFLSAEEGVGKAFVETFKRARIDVNKRNLQWSAYQPISELRERLSKKRTAPKIVIIDNITFYVDELKNGALRKLRIDFPETLFIFLAHEEDGKPYTSTAKMVKREAKIILYVEGLSVTVSGRCPGGQLTIDPERAALYHGQNILKNVS